MEPVAAAATVAWLASATPAWVAFRRALRDPAAAQRRVLERLLRGSVGTAFGRAHDLRPGLSWEELRERVPARGWDGLQPWVERAAAGEGAVLTREPITRFEPTSGSTSARKLVPSTTSSRAELSRAVGAWVVDTYRRDPALWRGPSYWSVTPALPAERTPGGLPVGFDDDAGYLGGVGEVLVRRALVRAEAGLQGEAFWASTARALILARDLRLVSVWNPSFARLLLDAVARHWDDVARSTSGRLARELARTDPARPWPRLRLVSAWADGAAARALPDLAAAFPGVPVQPKGLLATEGVVSIPFAGTWPLAVTSHALELELDDGPVIPAAQARPGQRGRVVVSTGAGLWRYALGDEVLVTGLLGATPTVRFLGRTAVVDTVGEKLTEAFVAGCLRSLGVEGFALLAPEPGGWVLYAERPPASAALERALGENPHYAWAVSLGQLRPVVVAAVPAGAGARYAAERAARGMRLGDVKPAVLEREGGWSAALGGGGTSGG
jgi:hypothetical protein